MTSVRSLAQQKLGLYLSNLKELAQESPLHQINDPATESLCSFSNGIYKALKGYRCLDITPDQIALNEFIPSGDDTFYLKTKSGSTNYVWTFTHYSFTDIFHQREGLGESGEIYLVGQDRKIKSASRFWNKWKNVEVRNQAVEEGLNGESGNLIVSDYRGIDVISSFTSFKYDKLSFVILSEIDLKEVLVPLKNGMLKLLYVSVILILINVIMAFFTTKDIIHKFRLMKLKINHFNRQIIKIQETERERIAYNLHDSIGQYLTALKWGLSHLNVTLKDHPNGKQIQELESLSENLIREVRTISHDIMPSLLKDFGLNKAIHEYLNVQQRIYNKQMSFHVNSEFANFSHEREFETNIYRIIQELVQNTIKHSDANVISLSIALDKEKLVMLYSDDGKGMAKNSPLPRSLQYRAQLFNGTLKREVLDQGLSFIIGFNLSETKNGKDKNIFA